MRLLHIIFIIVFAISGLEGYCVTPGKDKKPLEIELTDSVLTRLYLALMDRDVSKALDPDYNHEDESLSGMASLAAGFALAYSQPGSKHYQDPLLEEAVLRIVQPLLKRQRRDGAVARFGSDDPLPADEMARLIEGFIYINHTMDNALDETRQARQQFVLNGLTYLSGIDSLEMNSHKSTVCGVLALGAEYTGDTNFINAARKWLPEIRQFFKQDGQVLEGPGPDLKHSLLSIRGMFLYRLASGDEGWDEQLQNSLLWVTRLFTNKGIPLEGMSTQGWQQNGDLLATLLSAFNFYAEEEPALGISATQYLNYLIDVSRPVSFQENAFTFLKGGQYHSMPEVVEAVPSSPYAELYESEHSLYCLVGKNYQTAVTLRGRLPLKGLQTWAYQGEPPLILPQPNHVSGVTGTGILTRQTDVLWHQDPAAYRLQPVGMGIDLLVVHQESLQVGYLFSPDMTVVIYRQKNASRSNVRWNINRHLGADMENGTESEVSFSDSRSRILPPSILPKMERDGHNITLRYEVASDIYWFTFAGPESKSIVQPVLKGLVLVQLLEGDNKQNVLVNLSHEPFDEQYQFPGTSVDIPLLPPMSATLMEDY